MLETCRLKSREPTWFHEPHQGLRLLPSTIVAAAGLAEKSWLCALLFAGEGCSRPPGRGIDLIYFFCELPLFCEPEPAELLAAEPVVDLSEADSLSFTRSARYSETGATPVSSRCSRARVQAT